MNVDGNLKNQLKNMLPIQRQVKYLAEIYYRATPGYVKLRKEQNFVQPFGEQQ